MQCFGVTCEKVYLATLHAFPDNLIKNLQAGSKKYRNKNQ